MLKLVFIRDAGTAKTSVAKKLVYNKNIYEIIILLLISGILEEILLDLVIHIL